MEDPNYELCEGTEILQGDLIEKIQISKSSRKPAIYDLIILTNSCDIVNKDPPIILVAPYIEISEFQKKHKKFTNTHLKLTRKGQMFSYRLLPPCEIEDYDTETFIVDFGNIMAISLDSIQQHISDLDKRLRLRPPLREYISQAYAISIMRVSLPEEIPIKHAPAPHGRAD